MGVAHLSPAFHRICGHQVTTVTFILTFTLTFLAESPTESPMSRPAESPAEAPAAAMRCGVIKVVLMVSKRSTFTRDAARDAGTFTPRPPPPPSL